MSEPLTADELAAIKARDARARVVNDIGSVIPATEDRRRLLAEVERLQTQLAAMREEWGLWNPEASPKPAPHYTGSEAYVRLNHQRGHPSIRMIRRRVSEWEPTDV